MTQVYLLSHSYEYGEGNKHEESKIIGIYSTREKAEEVVTRLHPLPSFKDFPKKCFNIDEYSIDKDGGWTEGFIKWEDSY